ncbi:hypothetical protein N9I26_04720 [Pseudomonadales bacterium]|nr:hypothetical protein [Pseudomonadales bacterium]MDA8880409.1 hypothetical protein [Pseudomonadales bacterium]
MIKNFIIIASVTANFSFLVYFYKNFNDDVSTSSKPELSPASTMSTTLLSENNVIQAPSAIVPDSKIASADTVALPEIWESENYARLADLLRSQSYPEDLVRQIVLATISRDQLLSTQERDSSPYWLETKTDQSASDFILDELANKRLMLVSIFGADIVQDPLFETLFKPLNDSLSFLDSDTQIAVDETRKRASMSALQRSRGGFITEMRDDRFREAEELEASLRAILTADEFTEYELRESRLAARMTETMATFDYSELEFRDIFTIRRNNEGSEFTKLKDRQSYRERRTASNEEIKNYLGDQRYQEFERSQDPAYRSLLTIGERYGNTTSEITEVYEISRATETEVSEIRSDKSLTRNQRREMIVETRSRAMEEITKIAGEQSAKSIESNANSFRRFRGSH